MKDAIVIPVSALRRIFVMIVILILLIVLILVVRTQLFRAGIATLFAPSAAEVIDRDAYQAVFLTNGSTYFGKLEAQGDEWFRLSDVFYLSVGDQTTTPQLIKRGSEAQGPREPMIVPREQILFIENLRDDGEIVTLIRKFKSGQPTATAPPATVAPTSTVRVSPSPSPSR